MMYGWDKAAISQWLEAKKVKFGGGQDKNYALESASSVTTGSSAESKRNKSGVASVSTIASGADARRAKQTRTSPCRRVSRSSSFDPD